MTAPDAESALRLLDEHAFDAIITDIRLPGMDGVEFARRVREDPRFAAIPLAFMSAWKVPPRIKETPPVPYFPKPFDMDDLLAWVHSVSDSHDTEHGAAPADAPTPSG